MLKATTARAGDTMIEVLFAITIFSMVAVGGLTIMNRGTASAQQSLEVSLVKYEIDAQADSLRTLYDEAMIERTRIPDEVQPSSDSAISLWNNVLSKRVSQPEPRSNLVNGTGYECSSYPGWAFVINPLTLETSSSFRRPELFSRVTYTPSGSIDASEGIWVEAVKGNTDPGNPGYTDFYIRACWVTLGQSRPMTIGTIVRLYEPKA